MYDYSLLARRLRIAAELCSTLHLPVKLPGANPLKDAHAELDAAVLAAYGFSEKQDLLAQLLELNLEVARRIEAGETVVAPGIPPDYPMPKKLITDDCIQPRKTALLGDS